MYQPFLKDPIHKEGTARVCVRALAYVCRGIPASSQSHSAWSMRIYLILISQCELTWTKKTSIFYWALMLSKCMEVPFIKILFTALVQTSIMCSWGALNLITVLPSHRALSKGPLEATTAPRHSPAASPNPIIMTFSINNLHFAWHINCYHFSPQLISYWHWIRLCLMLRKNIPWTWK